MASQTKLTCSVEIRIMFKMRKILLHMTAIVLCFILAFQTEAQGLILCFCADGEIVIQTTTGSKCCSKEHECDHGPEVIAQSVSSCGGCTPFELPSSKQLEKVTPSNVKQITMPMLCANFMPTLDMASIGVVNYPHLSSLRTAHLARTSVLRV